MAEVIGIDRVKEIIREHVLGTDFREFNENVKLSAKSSWIQSIRTASWNYTPHQSIPTYIVEGSAKVQVKTGLMSYEDGSIDFNAKLDARNGKILTFKWGKLRVER